MEPDSTKVTSSCDKLLSTLEEARLDWSAQVEEQPEDSGQRAEVGEATDTENQPSNILSSKVPPSCEVATGDTSEELLEPPALNMLKD